MAEGKTSFEVFREWEQSLSPNQKAEYEKPLESREDGNEIGKIDLEKYAKGMNLVYREFKRNLDSVLSRNI